MPNRNHAMYLRHSIPAMLNQERPADEIIIFDDCSTDDSVAVIRDFQSRASNLRLIERERNKGVVANLNEGLALATGDYVAFPGADDLIHSDFLARTAALLDAHPAAACATGCAAIRDHNDRVTGYRPLLWPLGDEGYIGPDAYRRLLRRGDNHFLGAVLLYRREALVAIGGFDPLLGSMSDGIAARRLAARHGFCFTPAVLGVWRNQGGNYSMVSATDPQILAPMIARFCEVLEAEPAGLFDEDYAQRLACRIRFGGARLLAGSANLQDPSVRRRLQLLGLGGRFDRMMLDVAAGSGNLGRQLLAAWLLMRFRPMSIGDLAVALLRQHSLRAGRSNTASS
jgi:glycosyltransferase involved in cell wall biosynthesis